MQIKIDVSQVRFMVRKLQKDTENFSFRIERNLEKVKLRYYQYVMLLTPVDTGYLKSRWRNLPTQKSQTGIEKIWIGRITNDTYYLKYVNYGFWHVFAQRYIPGQFFLQKAMYLTGKTMWREMKP